MKVCLPGRDAESNLKKKKKKKRKKKGIFLPRVSSVDDDALFSFLNAT